MKLNLDKPFYLIAEYWLGDIQGFVKLGDDRKEIEKIFQEKYALKPNTLGVTEQSFELLELKGKVILDEYGKENRYENTRLLEQVKKQKEVIDKAIEYILECSINEKGHINVNLSSEEVGKLLDILNEALE